MVSAYVTGIFATQQGSDGAVDAESLQHYIDCLYNPCNRFTTCSILATHGIKNVDRNAIYRDIMALVQLRPRDTGWKECRRKLDDLVQSEDAEFFGKQLILPWSGEYRPLQVDEIQVEKDNIRYAIRVLDDFFGDGGHNMASPDSLSGWHPTGRIHHFLGWCFGRKHENLPGLCLMPWKNSTFLANLHWCSMTRSSM
ncbi:hypothetical protein IW261DRAFT_524377 [Armillaria novae-zelandiae]|uniref:Uncharacterized protein n=1 Tax=Armillaria novae-zelandiae TaxID=153914 RepID=A0AA39NZV7_9AGAR|nr:hypothetical protein IW261DRAFT_524377 [Armillaria novae-zelandiae]